MMMVDDQNLVLFYMCAIDEERGILTTQVIKALRRQETD